MSEDNSSPEQGEDHNERRIWWTITAVGIVVFVVMMLLGRPLVEGRLAAARNLDRATSMIAESNDDLAAIDAAVRAVAATGRTPTTEQALATGRKLRPTLEEAARLAETGYERLTSDEQKRAKAVTAMATARLDLLAAAELILTGGSDGSSGTTLPPLAPYDRAAEKVRQVDAALAKL